MTSRGGPSAVGAAVRLLLRGLRPPRETWTGVPAPRRRPAVDRAGITTEPRRVRSYLAATRGEEIEALDPVRGGVLPPVFPVVWETPLLLELFASGSVPLPRRGVLHLEGESVLVRPIRAGQPVRCRVELAGVEEAARGTRVTFESRNWNPAGQLCSENRLTVLVRADTAGRPTRPERPSEPADPAEQGEGGWDELDVWDLGAAHGRRYARASGDYNPIHLWPWTSRIFGYPRPILQGFCTEAMVAHTVVERVLGGDPQRLRRLRIRFRAPLSLPATARLLVRSGEAPTAGHFNVVGEDSPTSRPFASGSWLGVTAQG